MWLKQRPSCWYARLHMGAPERRYRRHEFPPLSLWICVGEEKRRHQLLDLSLGGALIGASELPPLGSEVEVLLAHAAWSEPLRATACVIHHRFADDDPSRPVGMGIEFLEFTGDGEERLSEVIAMLDRGREQGNLTVVQRDSESPAGHLTALRTEVRRAVALVMILQHEIGSYEEVDAQRRALTEHLLLEHRILKSDGSPVATEAATRAAQTRAAIAALEQALAAPLDPAVVATATAEIMAMHDRERQRARVASERVDELSERLGTEPGQLDKDLNSQRLAVEQLRETMRRERHGWQVAINTDLARIAVVDGETDALRKERVAAAEKQQGWLEGQRSEVERLTGLAASELSTGQDLARQRDAQLAETEALRAVIRSLTSQALNLASDGTASTSVTPAEEARPADEAVNPQGRSAEPPGQRPTPLDPLVAEPERDAGAEVDLESAAEIVLPTATPAVSSAPSAGSESEIDARVRQEFSGRLLRGGRLRPAPGFESTPVEPTDVAISVLLQETDVWEELLAGAPPSMRERIAKRVLDLCRDGSIEIVGGDEGQS